MLLRIGYLCFVFALFSMGLFSLPLQAEVRHNERDYVIEILIFTQHPGETANELPGPVRLIERVPEGARRLGATPTWQQLNGGPLPRVQPITPRLQRQARAIENSPDYRLLFHQAFRMRLVGRERSFPLLIEGGRIQQGQPELMGSLHLSVARFLHLETDLFLHHFHSEGTELNNGHGIVASSPMQQRRRMRSNELHFIDSPHLGLLIRIERVD